MHLIEVPAGKLLIQVGERIRFADVGDAHLELDLRLLAEIEPCSGVMACGVALAFLDSIILPRCEAAERLLESGREVERVTGVCAAEATRGSGSADGIAADDANTGAVVFASHRRKSSYVDIGVCAGGVHEEAGGLALRKMDAGDAGAIGNRKLDFASIG